MKAVCIGVIVDYEENTLSGSADTRQLYYIFQLIDSAEGEFRVRGDLDDYEVGAIYRLTVEED